MPMETKYLKQFFHKAEIILKDKIIFRIKDSIYAFIRLPKRFKINEEKRKKSLRIRLEEVERRIQFVQSKFESLTTFTKLQCFFRYYCYNELKCSCQTFFDRGTCKHHLATLLHLKKIENPYLKMVSQGSQVGRPRNCMNH